VPLACWAGVLPWQGRCRNPRRRPRVAPGHLCPRRPLRTDWRHCTARPPKTDDEHAAKALADAIERVAVLQAQEVQEIGMARFDPARHFRALAARPC
jgi:hypothetical protein